MLDFGSVALGAAAGAGHANVTNTGGTLGPDPPQLTRRLRLHNADATRRMPVVFRSTAVEVHAPALDVEPGETTSVAVSFRPRVEGPWRSTLQVRDAQASDTFPPTTFVCATVLSVTAT